MRGRARTKNLFKATQRRALTSGRDFRNGRALTNKTIAEGTPIRQYRANHDFGVSSRGRSSGCFCPRGDPPLLLSVSSRCGVRCNRRELQTSEEVEMRRGVGQKCARLGHKVETTAEGPWLLEDCGLPPTVCTCLHVARLSHAERLG